MLKDKRSIYYRSRVDFDLLAIRYGRINVNYEFVLSRFFSFGAGVKQSLGFNRFYFFSSNTMTTANYRGFEVHMRMSPHSPAYNSAFHYSYTYGYSEGRMDGFIVPSAYIYLNTFEMVAHYTHMLNDYTFIELTYGQKLHYASIHQMNPETGNRVGRKSSEELLTGVYRIKIGFYFNLLKKNKKAKTNYQ